MSNQTTKVLSSLGAVALAISGGSAISATTYTHNSITFGSGVIHYVNPGSGLTDSDFVSASVTYNSALAPNLLDFTNNNQFAEIPSYWTFSVGALTWTPANSHFYVASVDTDSTGKIIGWYYDLYTNPGYAYPEVYLISSTPTQYS